VVTTFNKYSTDHKTTDIQYTVLPGMPMVAQLIEIFPRILWNLQIIGVAENVVQHFHKE